MNKKIEVTVVGSRKRFEQWIASRGGVLVWESQLIGDDSGLTFTPARGPHGEDWSIRPPHWKLALKERVEDIDRFEFAEVTWKEHKRFHVAVRAGSQGLMLKLTDGSTRRLRKALSKARMEFGRSTYEFDGMTQDAVILVPDKELQPSGV